MTKRRALLWQSDPAIRALLRRQLFLQQFHSTCVTDGSAAWAHVQARAFDLIVLDAAPTGISVTTLCRAIRRIGPNQRSAVIIVSRFGEETERVLGLAGGADDYLTVPFSIPELHARIAALMRRSRLRHALAPPRGCDAHDLTLDLDRRTVTLGATIIALTRREFDLLHALMGSPGTVFTRAKLLACIGSRSVMSARVIDPLVSRVRTKLKKAGLPSRLIRTVPGVGYTFRR
jgi:DNA-binding response OmpR family regulator